MKNSLVLVQYRNDDNKGNTYNDFIGNLYHFPGNESKSYLRQFEKLPIEFIYYEPGKNGGKSEYFGYGKITTPPFPDKREKGHYFVKIDEYKAFKKPVSHKKTADTHWESDNPSYNAQNSVRYIPEKTLEEICLEGEIQLNFQVDAHLIKVLGEQLIGSEKVGVLELVKNAYDAGATDCKVYIEKSPSLPELEGNKKYNFPELNGPVIVIEDNGSGMTKDIIENGWLRPASTIKTDVKEKLKIEQLEAKNRGTLANYNALVKKLKEANNGRIPLGEKGVGRFATHRLGRYLILKTKVSSLDYEYVLEIDWDEFDKISSDYTNLDTIGISLKRQKPSRDYGEKNSGTQIIIYGGREGFDWSEKKVRDVYNSIIQLNSPNPRPDVIKTSFSAELIVPQIPNLINEDIVAKHKPTFEFSGLVNEKGMLDYELKFNPPLSVPMPSEKKEDELNLLNYCNQLEKQGELTECGPFYVHLKLWYRKSPWVQGPDANDFYTYLDNYGGISIYRDTINVFSSEWGTQNDWLGLSKEHIKKGWRVSYYNMIGNIEIDQNYNLNITDKTNREGLIENNAYNDLKILMRGIIETIILNEWSAKRDENNNLTKNLVRNPKELSVYTKQVMEINDNIQKKYPVEDDPFKILNHLGESSEARKTGLISLSTSMKNLRESIEVMEEVQNMLTEQAGYGLAIAVSVHEINKITSNFYYGVNEVLKSGRFERERLEELMDSSSSLRSELKRLGPLRAIRSERKQSFDIKRPIQYMLSVYEREMKKYGISYEIKGGSGNFDVYARYGAMVQVFSNLMANSCYWLNTAEAHSKTILIDIDEDSRAVIFADDGPGIHDSILPYLFKPGYSMKIPRSGLGLYITQYYMQEIKGYIQNINNEKYRIKDLQGAQFLLDFSKVPKEYNK